MNTHLNPGFGVGSSVQGASSRHNPPQDYGTDEWASQGGGWVISQAIPYPAPAQVVMHNRSASDHGHMTNLGVSGHTDSSGRRFSLPFPNYPFQSVSPADPVTTATLQPIISRGYPRVDGNQYRQRPALTIPSNPGGFIPGPHSTSSPLYSSQPFSHPNQPLSPFQPETPFPPFSQGGLIIPDPNHYGGRSTVDRASRSNPRVYPYPTRGMRQTSPAWDSSQGSGSIIGLSPLVTGGQMAIESSDSTTSPGADSDPYYSYPNTPANNGGPIPEIEDAARREEERKQRQKLRKQDERAAEADQLERLKKLLKLEKKKPKPDVLEQVIRVLGGRIPARRNEPTPDIPGRDRSDRARRVSGSRADVSRLFEVIATCVGHTSHNMPSRVALLQRVAEIIEQKGNLGVQLPGPQGGIGPGGNSWMA